MFLDNHGVYEIIAKVKNSCYDKEKEIRFVIEANDKSDAKRIAEKQLRRDGYSYIEISSIIKTKQTRKVNNVIYTTNSEESKRERPDAKKKKIAGFIILIVSLAILIGIFVLVATGVVGGE